MCDRPHHRAWHKVVRLHRAAFSSTDTIPMLQPDVIRKTLAHRGLADEPPRPPPPGFRELQYASDPQFVHDPGPAGPVGRQTDQDL